MIFVFLELFGMIESPIWFRGRSVWSLTST